jgi:hypothetical protein
MTPRFSPHFEWLILAFIAITLATCCVKQDDAFNVGEKRVVVMEGE